MADEELDTPVPDAEEVDFSRTSVQAMYRSGEARSINPDRWERVRSDVLFEDVVNLLTGHDHTRTISCPFHGTDSTPSFWLYRGSNDGWCFGCPPGEQYYDSVRFVAKHLQVSRVKALRWLEKKFELPDMADVVEEAEETEEITVQVEFSDLSEAFIQLAWRDIAKNRDPLLAEEYLRIYFEAERAKSALPLAQVLGRNEVQRIAKLKAYR